MKVCCSYLNDTKLYEFPPILIVVLNFLEILSTDAFI